MGGLVEVVLAGFVVYWLVRLNMLWLRGGRVMVERTKEEQEATKMREALAILRRRRWGLMWDGMSWHVMGVKHKLDQFSRACLSIYDDPVDALLQMEEAVVDSEARHGK